MSFFSSSRWDHSRISLRMKTFANVWTLSNTQYSSVLHRDDIIKEFFLARTHTPTFNFWPKSDVLILVIDVRSLKNFADDEHVPQSLFIAKHPMSLFFSSRWDQWTISFIIITFANVSLFADNPCPFCLSWTLYHWRVFPRMNAFSKVSSLTNIRCPFSLHRDEIIQEFLLGWTHSPKFCHWHTSDVPFLLIQMRSIKKFYYHHQIPQCLIIGQQPISFFLSLSWDTWRIFFRIITFPNVWWLTNMLCAFSIHRDDIIEK